MQERTSARPVLDGDSMPRYMQLERALARETWMEDGYCRTRPPEQRVFWHRSRADGAEYDHTKFKLALSICRICKAQWDCLAFAVREGQPFSIYALAPADRERLGEEADWEQLIAEAKANKVSVVNLIPIVNERRAARKTARRGETSIRSEACSSPSVESSSPSTAPSSATKLTSSQPVRVSSRRSSTPPSPSTPYPVTRIAASSRDLVPAS